MKTKIIALLIIVFTIATGCQKRQIESVDIPSSEYEKLAVTDINYDKATKTIYFNTENKSEEIITTGLYYTIEKYKNKMWDKTNLTDKLGVIEIGLLVNSNETLEEKIDLSQINSLKDGLYRIKKEYSITDEIINQYIQIEVKGEDVINFSSYNEIKK